MKQAFILVDPDHLRAIESAVQGLADEVRQLRQEIASPAPKWMTREAMAAHLGVSPGTVTAWANAGRLHRQGQGRGVLYAINLTPPDHRHKK